MKRSIREYNPKGYFKNWHWMGWYWLIESPQMKNNGWGYWPFMRVRFPDPELIRHEESHLKTELSLLMVIHGLLYLLFWLIYGYENNPFERYAQSLEPEGSKWRFMGWVLFLKPKLVKWDGIGVPNFTPFVYRSRLVVGMRPLARWQYHKIYLPMWGWICAALWVIVRNAICDCVYLTVATATPVIVVTIAVFLWTYNVRRSENRKNYIYDA